VYDADVRRFSLSLDLSLGQQVPLDGYGFFTECRLQRPITRHKGQFDNTSPVTVTKSGTAIVQSAATIRQVWRTGSKSAIASWNDGESL
jgi:hypothetical protein